MVLTLYKIMANRQDRLFHFHMHLIPDMKEIGGNYLKPGTLTDEVKNEILEKLKSC